MPLTSDVNRWEYDGDGVTPDFPYENLIFAATDLEVYFDEVLQVSGIAVSGVGVETGGNVTPTPVVADGVKIVIVRAVPFTQPQDFVNNEAVDAEAFEDGLNRMTILAQQLRDTIGRQLTLPAAESGGADMTVPAQADRLGAYQGYDAVLGSSVALAPPAGTTAVSVFMAGVITAEDAAAARTLLGVTGSGYGVTESDPPAMTVEVAEGAFFNSLTRLRVSNAPQTSPTITAPSVNPRIDIAYIDRANGVRGIETGVEAASPVPPALAVGRQPLAEIALSISTTQITDSLITDVRDLNLMGSADFLDEDDMVSDSATGVPSQQSVKAFVEAATPRGVVNGLKVSNNGTDAIDVATGSILDDADAVTIKLVAALTDKQLGSVWAPGSSAGMLDTGVEAVNSTYHIYLIRRSDTGNVDVLASLDAASPTMPADYDQKQLFWSIMTDATPDIRPFYQWGDECYWKTRINNINTTTPSTSALEFEVTTPLGIETIAIVHGAFHNNQTQYSTINSPDDADVIPSLTNHDLRSFHASNQTGSSGEFRRKTNETSKLRYRSTDASVNSFVIDTVGFVHPRGRNAG